MRELTRMVEYRKASINSKSREGNALEILRDREAYSGS